MTNIASSSATFEEICRIPETINFAEQEEHILHFWTENKIFEKCLKDSKDKKR